MSIKRFITSLAVASAIPIMSMPGHAAPMPTTAEGIRKDLQRAGYSVTLRQVPRETRAIEAKYLAEGKGLSFRIYQFKNRYSRDEYFSEGIWERAFPLGTSLALGGISVDEYAILDRLYGIQGAELEEPFAADHFVKTPFDGGYQKLHQLMKSHNVSFSPGRQHEVRFSDGTYSFFLECPSCVIESFKGSVTMTEAMAIARLLAGDYAKDIDFTRPLRKGDITQYTYSSDMVDAAVILKQKGDKVREVKFTFYGP